MEEKIINSNVLKDKLWKILSSNRGQLDTSFYKDIALSSFFLFAANKKYEIELEKSWKKNPDLPKEEIAKEKSFFTIWVPPNARLDHLRQHLNNDFKITVSQALEEIEKENSKLLKDASFANLFTNPDISNQLLINVFQELDKLDWVFSEKYNGDYFGEIYQFLVSNFASSMGKKGGEFYTPTCVVELLVELIKPLDGIVYDPCCGTGGMFIQSKKFEKHHANKEKRRYDIQIYGQEINVYTWRLAKINLALRGIIAHLGKAEDTFKNDQHPNLQIDYAISNPPYGLEGYFRNLDDNRWVLGVPPLGKVGANLAWISVIISKLKPQGSAAILMVNSILFANDKKAVEIRRKLIEDNLLEAIIILPPKLFFEVNIDIYVLIIRKGREEKDILTINSQDLFVKYDAKLNILTPENITEIVNIYDKFREDKKKIDSSRVLIISPLEINKDEFCVLLPKRFLKNNLNLKEKTLNELVVETQILFAELDKIREELGAVYEELLNSSNQLKEEKKEQEVPLKLITTIPNFNFSSPVSRSQMLSNVFFLSDLLFAKNVDATITVKDYFKLIGGKTPSTKKNSYYENGTLKWLNQGTLLDTFFLDSQLQPVKWITEKAVQEEKVKPTIKNSVLLARMSGSDFLRRIVWCKSDEYFYGDRITNFLPKSKNKEEQAYNSATLFFALRNQTSKISSLMTGSRGLLGEIRIKEFNSLQIPWVSNPKIQEKLFNLLNNDLAKLIKEKQEQIKEKQEQIKEKQEQIKEKLLRVNIPTKENDKN